MCFCTTVATNKTFTELFSPLNSFCYLPTVSTAFRPTGSPAFLLSSISKRPITNCLPYQRHPHRSCLPCQRGLMPAVSREKEPRPSTVFRVKDTLTAPALLHHCEKVSGRKRCMYDTKDRKNASRSGIKCGCFGCFPGTVFHAKEVAATIFFFSKRLFTCYLVPSSSRISHLSHFSRLSPRNNWNNFFLSFMLNRESRHRCLPYRRGLPFYCLPCKRSSPS